MIKPIDAMSNELTNFSIMLCVNVSVARRDIDDGRTMRCIEILNYLAKAI